MAKGISFNSRLNRWEVSITRKGIRYFIGRFTDHGEALSALQNTTDGDLEQYRVKPRPGRFCQSTSTNCPHLEEDRCTKHGPFKTPVRYNVRHKCLSRCRTPFVLGVLTILLTVTSCTTPSRRPLCRHIVLSQYAAFKDAGFTTELVHFKNTTTLTTPKFKYHIAVRIKSPNTPDAPWLYVEQPPITFTTTTTPPPNTQFLKTVNPKTVLQWTERVKGN